MVEELRAAIEQYERIDGHDVLVTTNSVTRAMLSGDKAIEAVEPPVFRKKTLDKIVA